MNSDWQFRCAPLPAGYAERWRAGLKGKNLMGRGVEITMWTCSKCEDLKFDAAPSCGCVEFTV